MTSPQAVTDNLKKATDALAAWGAADEDGKEILDKLDKLLSTTKALSKLSMGLGLVGAGLGLLGAILGGKSDTDRILDAIKGLGGKVDGLSKLMLDQFANLEAEVHVSAAITQITGARDTLNVARSNALSYLNELQRVPQDTFKLAEATKDLKGNSIHEIEVAVESLAAAASGRGHTPIFQGTYMASNGEVLVMADLGRRLFTTALMGSVTAALLRSLDEDLDAMSDEDRLASLDAKAFINAEYFDPKLQEIHREWDTYYQLARQNWRTNIEIWLQFKVFPYMPAAIHDAAAVTLVDGLQKRAPWKDWAAIVYDPVGRYEQHVSSIKLYKRQSVLFGSLNVAIGEAELDDPAVGGGLSTHVTMSGPDLPTYSTPGPQGKDHWSHSSYKGPAESAIYSANENHEVTEEVKDTRDVYNALDRKGAQAWVGRVGSHAVARTTNPARFKMVTGTTFSIAFWG